MIYKFKSATRVPKGVTPDAVLGELDKIEAVCGKKGVEAATDEVIAHPGKYPALRAFGPASPDEAFRNAIRDGITYAVRSIVPAEEDGEDKVVTEVRVLYIVTDDEGDRVWEPLEVVAKTEPYQKQLITELEGDAQAFTRKLTSTLAEIKRILGH